MLRTEKEEALMEADKAIEEKKQAMSKVDKVSHVNKRAAAFVWRSSFSMLLCIHVLYIRFIFFNIVQLECDVAGLECKIKVLEHDLESTEERLEASLQLLNSAAEVEFVNNFQQ